MCQAVFGQADLTGKIEHLIESIGINANSGLFSFFGWHIAIAPSNCRARNITGTAAKRLFGGFFFGHCRRNFFRIARHTNFGSNVRAAGQSVIQRLPVNTIRDCPSLAAPATLPLCKRDVVGDYR